MLNRNDILEAMRRGTVLIDKFNKAQLNPNSYDVCLGNHFYHVTWRNGKPQFSYFHREDGQPVFIPQGGTLLGMTKEIVGSIHDIVTEIRAKSSTRRVGITICDDAGFGDVGYVNHWTVELTSHITPFGTHVKDPSQATLIDERPCLIVGEPFAQMVFFRTETGLTPEESYHGQFAENDWPTCMIPKKYR